MNELSCRIEVPSVQGLEDQEITVGRYFNLVCQGDFDQSFKFEDAQFDFSDKNMNLTYKFVQVIEKDSKSVSLKTVAYSSGEYTFENLSLNDGERKINLGPQKFEVKSVIKQQEQTQASGQQTQEPPKPFGYALSELSFPTLYVVIIAFSILSILVYVVRKVQIRQKIRKYQNLISSYDSAQSADNQFYKKIRLIEKNNFPIDDLEEAIKIYLMRTFQLPFLFLDKSVVYKLMLRKYPREKNTIKAIYLVLVDLDLLKKNVNVTEEQKIKLVQKFYKLILECEKVKNKNINEVSP